METGEARRQTEIRREGLVASFPEAWAVYALLVKVVPSCGTKHKKQAVRPNPRFIDSNRVIL